MKLYYNINKTLYIIIGYYLGTITYSRTEFYFTNLNCQKKEAYKMLFKNNNVTPYHLVCA